MRLGDLVAEVEVLAVQVDAEGGVVVAAQQRRSRCLPGETVAAASADRVPELVQVQAGSLGCSLGKTTPEPEGVLGEFRLASPTARFEICKSKGNDSNYAKM